MKKKIIWGVIILFGLWLVFGKPADALAGIFWSETAAPWEKVHAFYYPDRNNLFEDKRKLDVGSVEACRDWVDEQARAANDPTMINGDYECGVGCEETVEGGGVYVCRLTVE